MVLLFLRLKYRVRKPGSAAQAAHQGPLRTGALKGQHGPASLPATHAFRQRTSSKRVLSTPSAPAPCHGCSENQSVKNRQIGIQSTHIDMSIYPSHPDSIVQMRISCRLIACGLHSQVLTRVPPAGEACSHARKPAATSLIINMSNIYTQKSAAW